MKTTRSEKKIGKTALVILILSFHLSPSKTYSQSKTQTGSDEIQINENVPAPYAGVLMPTPKYLYYVEQQRDLKYLTEHPAPCEEAPKLIDTVPWFISGLLIGFLSGLVVK